MRLDARFINIIYKIAEQDPPLTQEQQDIPEGALWLNEVTGKIFIALKHPKKKNKIVWINLVSNESKLMELTENVIKQISTSNVIDVFKDDSIVAFYPFDGHIYDIANKYNGFWNGEEKYDKGIFGQAVKFDGYNCIILPDELISQIKSISLWVNANDTKSNGGILSINEPYGTLELVTTRSNNDKYGIHLVVNNTHIVNNDNYITLLDKNKWYHIVIVIDDIWNNTLLYINGHRVYGEYGTPDLKSSSIFTLGSQRGVSHFKGIVDQVRIFNRPLTPEEVLVLFNESYLITKAARLLVNKLGRIKKEIVYIPGGDNITKLEKGQPISVTIFGKIGNITNPPPQIKENKYGTELYFPDKTAIEVIWPRKENGLEPPFTVFVKFKINKNNNSEGSILGIEDFRSYTDLKSIINTFKVSIANGKTKFNIKFYYPQDKTSKSYSISISDVNLEVGKYYYLFIITKQNEIKVMLFDDENSIKKIIKKPLNDVVVGVWFNTRVALGATIRSNNSSDSFAEFANSELYIDSFRIFESELSEEDALVLVKENQIKGVLISDYLPRINIFDTLKDNLEAFYNFNKVDISDRVIAIDLSGNDRHEVITLNKYENIYNCFGDGLFGKALNCNNVDKRLKIHNLPVDVDFITVCFWMKWTGKLNQNGDIPFGFHQYALLLHNNKLGFTTGNNEIYGINNIQNLINKWAHICAVFPKQSTTNLTNAGAELWINGKKREIHYVQGNFSENRTITSTAYISGWGIDSLHAFHGYIDQFRIYSRKLTEKEIKLLARERYYFYK